MILSSFQSQYGIRLTKEINEMKWDEFKDLISGLGPDTPLGRVVQIRSEDDPDILKHFTKEQSRIRNEWREHAAKNVSEKELGAVLEAMKNAFIAMAGGAND